MSIHPSFFIWFAVGWFIGFVLTNLLISISKFSQRNFRALLNLFIVLLFLPLVLTIEILTRILRAIDESIFFILDVVTGGEFSKKLKKELNK